MRDGRRIAVIGGTCAVAVVALGLGAYSLLGGGTEDDPAPVAATSDGKGEEEGVQKGPLTDEEVKEVSEGFLSAWSGGEAAAAAGLTDDEGAAEQALAGLVERAQLTDLTAAEGAPAGTSVPFAVTATVAYEGIEAEWEYDSELTVVRDTTTGDAVVEWDPTVLHPGLTEGQLIETGPVLETAPVVALDRHGDPLSAEEHPALGGVLTGLSERYAEQSGAGAGVETRIVDAEGATVEQLLLLAEPVPGEVPTTIDPGVQQAAEKAVAGLDRASVVAVQPSTGAILGLANTPADGVDIALEGSYAPGSTFKIVTASMLIEKDLAASGAKHPCPKYFEHGGWKFQNLDEFEIKNGTFADSFAASCNTAFISQAPELGDGALGDHARDIFGLGLEWQVGVASMDGSVPTEQNAQMAASLIGQGAVRMNPMTMASVSATVKEGEFRQPHLVPASFDGRALAEAPHPLPGAAADELRGLMRRTAENGTAAEAMAGLDGDIGGKTGSAEVDGQDKPNAWFTAYRNDLAVAAVVPASGHGGTNAGPVVAEVLRTAP